MFIPRENLADAEHLLSPFSSPFFRVKWLYDYGFRGADSMAQLAAVTPLDSIPTDGGK
jgi:hypothetical protein